MEGKEEARENKKEEDEEEKKILKIISSYFKCSICNQKKRAELRRYRKGSIFFYLSGNGFQLYKSFAGFKHSNSCKKSAGLLADDSILDLSWMAR